MGKGGCLCQWELKAPTDRSQSDCVHEQVAKADCECPLYYSKEQRMIIVSYDISDDKLRTRFSKYLSRFGHRLQYSVFEIDNSPRIVDNIVSDLKNRYEKLFSQCDSVMIFKLSSSCEVMRFGYAKNDEKDFFIVT